MGITLDWDEVVRLVNSYTESKSADIRKQILALKKEVERLKWDMEVVRVGNSGERNVKMYVTGDRDQVFAMDMFLMMRSHSQNLSHFLSLVYVDE